ncbi:hypothetical protein GXP67_30605 [Rhodocytophaga rosea]|uniref:Uncharacterized protein n=1 Tax=Rhodocytophaga rosea TaxID=2704465 RepID=A0A6C0GRI6_9BACT|nr:hypothetical protein [Rhodocytophaga rosea]QHT70691.1 hypothetical protein GXP67_30605 [Rhodocytophaga rosea]
MKAFLQSSMAIFLGFCLLYAFYQKKMEQPQLVQASDIEMDSLFFVDQQAFKNKQLVVNQLDIEAILPVEISDKTDSLRLAAVITDSHKKRKEKPKIEIYELKKAPKTNLADIQLSESRLTAVISSQLKENTTAETATASIADANTTEVITDEHPQTEKKKKFLFFSKKNKNN